MRGLLFILAVLALLLVGALQIGLVRFAEPRPAQPSTLADEAALVGAEEPVGNVAR